MKKSDIASDKFQIQALSKGLSVLDCFRDIDEYGITEIGNLVNLPDSSVQRIVNTLEAKGYLYQNLNNKKYRLTPRVLLTCTRSGNYMKWKEQARKHMVALNELCNENVNLAVRHDNVCSYIELVESKQLLRPNFTLGDFYPIYCTGLGRCLLSDLTDSEIDSSLPEILDARTPFTVTDKKKLLEQIKEVRKSKYAVDDEEFYLGLHCIASPIHGIGNKVIAAISVTAPKVRMDKQAVDNLIPAIINTAQIISEEYQTLFAEQS